MKNVLEIGRDRCTIENVVRAAKKQIDVKLCNSPEFIKKIKAGSALIDDCLKKGIEIYGVTTGYGDSCTRQVNPENYCNLPVNLTRYHGCGMGEYFNKETVRAIMIIRLNTLAQGYSGVSMELLESIYFFIQHDILPLIPQEGSVGASGDLTPLSYLAGALIGERQVIYKDAVRSSADVLAELGRPVYKFRPKEALAIMNGTAVMNAIAVLAFSEAEYLADLACRVTAMNTIALKGNASHFNKRLFELKPHLGQALAAEKMYSAMETNPSLKQVNSTRIQDNYSIRCAPHVIGVFYDISESLKSFIETEMNSSNDNPLIDPETQSIYHGGHFYGGHICFAMDSLKNIVANIADLMDRQLALLVDFKFNRDLPANLTGASEENLSISHGLKAVQIAASAWTAEALKNTMPMSVFSRSTECHNQDKVSMGTIAARDCVRINKLTSQVLAASLITAFQAINIRLKRGELTPEVLGGAEKTYKEISEFFKPLEDDRPLEEDLRKTLQLIEEKHFTV